MTELNELSVASNRERGEIVEIQMESIHRESMWSEFVARTSHH